MKIFFIMMPYSIGNGRPSPSCARISARVCGLGLRPAIARAGSTPGVLKKMTNTTTVITNMTTTVHSVRRTTNVSMRPAPACSRASLPHPQLRPGIERVADAVAEHVERQHRQHDQDAGRDRYPRSGVEELLAVVDERAPADIGRLDADRQERQGRLCQDGRRDHQR